MLSCVKLITYCIQYDFETTNKCTKCDDGVLIIHEFCTKANLSGCMSYTSEGCTSCISSDYTLVQTQADNSGFCTQKR